MRKLSVTLFGAMAYAAISAVSGLSAAEHWPDERTAGPFAVHAEFPLGEYQDLLRDLANLHEKLAAAVQIAAPQEPIEVYIFATQESYKRYLRANLPDFPYRRALFVKQGAAAQVLACLSRQLETELRHECTHALLHSALPVVPLWLDEGLAQYFELPSGHQQDRRLSQARWRSRFGMSWRIEDLRKIDDPAAMHNADYISGLAWVHFIFHGPTESRDVLIEYLADLQARQPPGDLIQRLQQRTPDIDQQMSRYFATWRVGKDT